MFRYAMIASVCCLTFGVNAQTVLLRDYKVPKDEEFKAFNELYLAGVKEGLLTSNAKLAMDGKPKLFCLPPKKEVTAQEAGEIIVHQANTVPDADNYPISILLLAGFIDTFPCDEPTGAVRAHPGGAEPAEQSELKHNKRHQRRMKAIKPAPEPHRKAKSS
jgi:Rap1a immunity proteins